MDRRTFVQSALLGSASVSGLVRAADRKPRPIIDTHQHLWDRKQFKLPWIAKNSRLDRDFTLREYRQAVDGLNVVKTVYMEVDVDPTQQDAEADFVLGLCRQSESRMVAAVISGRPGSEGFARYLRRFKEEKAIKGIRQVLHGASTPAGYCLDKAFVAGVCLLGEWGKCFDLCMRPKELGDGAKLIDACPNTRFILDHCGNGPVGRKDRETWKRGLDAIARKKQVVCKISGIIASADPERWTVDDLAPVINHTLEAFGPDRVMFAGDWPVCTLAASFRQWVEALQTIVKDRPEAQQDKLFHDNAVRFYQL